jgi:hypothetical protein
VMIVDILPVKEIQKRYHAWKNWPAIMKEKTKGLPIVFSNSYQRASKYWFYSGQMTYSQNLYKQRRNNYNFWPLEDSMLGKPVYFLDIYELWRFKDSIKTAIGWVGYQYDPSFVSYAKLKIEMSETKFRVHPADSITIHAVTKMPQAYYNFISGNKNLGPKIIISVFDKFGWIKDFDTPLTIQQILQGSFQFSFYPQLKKGNYFLQFAIGNPLYNLTHNSDKIELVVE